MIDLRADRIARGAAMSGLTDVRNHPDTCDEEVTRKGELQPCENIAVAVRIDPDGGTLYPVCGRHARRPMVRLRDLLDGNDA